MQTGNGVGLEISCESIWFWAAMALVVKNTVNNRASKAQYWLQVKDLRCETMMALWNKVFLYLQVIKAFLRINTAFSALKTEK